MAKSKNVQIDEKLAKANDMLSRLSQAEKELNIQKSNFSESLTEVHTKLTDHFSKLTNDNNAKFIEIQTQVDTKLSNVEKDFTSAIETNKTNCTDSIKKVENDCSKKIVDFESQIKKEILDSQEKSNKLLTELTQAEIEIKEIKSLLTDGKNPKSGWNAQVKVIVDDVEFLKKSAVADQKEIADAKIEVVDGDKTKVSLLASAREAENGINEFYDRIYGNVNGEYDGKPSLEHDLEEKRTEMVKITDYTTSALKELTDDSLDAAFSNISNTAVSRGTFALISSVIILLVMAWLSWQALQPNMKAADFVYRLAFLIPLGVAVFFLNRERKVQHIVEITYKYKSALAKALKGYRNLYNLQHSSEEYMELFNVLKHELLQNPMRDAKRYMDQDMFQFKLNVKEGSIDTKSVLEEEKSTAPKST